MAESSRRPAWFIERLTVRSWFGAALPRLLGDRAAFGPGGRCVVFDGSPAGWRAARVCGWLLGLRLEPAAFRLAGIRDAQGLNIRWRLVYQDLGEVVGEAMTEPAVGELLQAADGDERLRLYLAKAMAKTGLADRRTLWRALLVLQMSQWYRRELNELAAPAVCVLERRVWFRALAAYAGRHGIRAVAGPGPMSFGAWWRSWLLTPRVKRLLYRAQALGRRNTPRGGRAAGAGIRPRLAVEYYGQLNLNRPGWYSDLCFVKRSTLPADRVVVTFNLEGYPLDTRTHDELALHGFEALALRPRIAQARNARVFLPRLTERPAPQITPPRSLRGPEGRWLRSRAREYDRELAAFWAECFASEGVRAYVSWFKYTETHCAIAEALRRTGGVMALYQRSYETHPSPELAACADVVFGFSPAAAELERQCGSAVRYLVAAGYLGDYTFPALRREAEAIRRMLQQRGAEWLLSFTDENSYDEERWSMGHSWTQHNYAFLLERVLEEPRLGLIVKPKVPSTLRKRLGPVARLLERAEKTGRCLLLDGGDVKGRHGSVPPAAAALASDVMVHGHLFAATAGVESALAGVPTLLLDREGWSVSPFYRLGVGRVVFTEWEALWRACRDHWAQSGGVPGFGDWSSMLDELDPFRDGRAAERVGVFLHWLLDGFDAGLDRDQALTRAVERYAGQWGRDKVVEMAKASSPTEPAGQPALVEPVSAA